MMSPSKKKVPAQRVNSIKLQRKKRKGGSSLDRTRLVKEKGVLAPQEKGRKNVPMEKERWLSESLFNAVFLENREKGGEGGSTRALILSYPKTRL